MEKPTHCERRGLDSPTPLFSVTPKGSPPIHFFEVSLNRPRTKRYNQLLSKQQKKSFAFIFNKMRDAIPSDKPKSYHQTYEYSSDGNIHTHAWFTVTGNYCISGIIADIVKIYKQYIRCGVYNDHRYYSEYSRYKDESACVQYVDLSTTEGVDEANRWETYIMKYQNYQN